MQSSNIFPVSARVLLPLILGVLLGILAIPKELFTAYHNSSKAEAEKQPAEVVEGLRKIASLQPWQYFVWERIGFYEMELGEWQAAIGAFLRADDLGVSTEDGLIALGESYLQLEKPQDALETWKLLLDRFPPSAELFEKIVSVEEELQLYSEEINILQRWMDYEPENQNVQYKLALLLAVIDPQQSLDIIRQIAEYDDQFLLRTRKLVSVLETVIQEGETSYQKLLVGRALADIDEWALAQAAFSESVLLQPDFAEAWAFLGEAKQHLDQDGWPELEKASQLDPDSVLVKALTALYWRRQNDPSRAQAALTDIIAREPDAGIWQIELGNTYAQMGNLNSAMSSFQTALNIEPDNPLMWREMIRFCLANSLEVRTVALPAARQYLLLDRHSSQSLDSMGWVLLVLEDYISAERFLLSSIENDEMNASAHLHLGQVYLALDQPEAAFQHLSLASSLRSEDPQVTILARRLLDRFFATPG